MPDGLFESAASLWAAYLDHGDIGARELNLLPFDLQVGRLPVRLAGAGEPRPSVLAIRLTSPTIRRTAQRWHRSKLDVLRNLIRYVARRWQSSQCSESGLSSSILIPVRKRTLS
jgi:hypothetical protein